MEENYNYNQDSMNYMCPMYRSIAGMSQMSNGICPMCGMALDMRGTGTEMQMCPLFAMSQSPMIQSPMFGMPQSPMFGMPQFPMFGMPQFPNIEKEDD